MNLLQILLLALIQGLTELLPVSSSAHVIVAERIMGLDPASPEMTLLLVMLHSGTMLAVIVYFWPAWRETFFPSAAAFWRSARLLIISTVLTGLVGYLVKWGIETLALRGTKDPEIESIFGNLTVVAVSLAAVGLLIIYAGLKRSAADERNRAVGWREAGWMGAVQGLCLPFRGFSRSGATISTGLILGVARSRVEEYSFALAVILTPPVVGREIWRVLGTRQEGIPFADSVWQLFGPGLAGLILSFFAGLLALRWLSRWLEKNHWHFFGFYCLAASVAVLLLLRVIH